MVFLLVVSGDEGDVVESRPDLLGLDVLDVDTDGTADDPPADGLAERLLWVALLFWGRSMPVIRPRRNQW
jgi:hypothetical protein